MLLCRAAFVFGGLLLSLFFLFFFDTFWFSSEELWLSEGTDVKVYTSFTLNHEKKKKNNYKMQPNFIRNYRVQGHVKRLNDALLILLMRQKRYDRHSHILI